MGGKKDHQAKNLAEDVEYIPTVFQGVLPENSEFVKNLKEEAKQLREDKLARENEMELIKAKNDMYEKELNEMRELVSELRAKLTKTNEETFKLEQNTLNNTIQLKNNEIEILTKENQQLRKQIDQVQLKVDNIISENNQFRIQSNSQVIRLYFML